MNTPMYQVSRTLDTYHVFAVVFTQTCRNAIDSVLILINIEESFSLINSWFTPSYCACVEPGGRGEGAEVFGNRLERVMVLWGFLNIPLSTQLNRFQLFFFIVSTEVMFMEET